MTKSESFKSFGMIVSLLLLSVLSFGQIVIPPDTSKSICRPGAVIFEKVNNLEKSKSRKSITLEISDILLAEKLFLENYSHIDGVWVNDRNLTAKQVRKKYFNYARQYVGYIDDDGSKYVLIQLLNFRVSKTDKMNFYNDWRKKFVFGVGGFFEINMRRFIVNLSKQEVNFF